MGMWDWLGRMMGLPVQTFSESAPMPIDQAFYEMRHGAAARVTRGEALSVSAVQKGRNLICSIGSLPLLTKDASNRMVRNPLLEQIDLNVANVVTMTQTVEDLLF